MQNSIPAGYSQLDHSEILRFLFHPRKEEGRQTPPPNSVDIRIPVDEGIAVGGRLHPAQKQSPTILFFHGNGEIAADYDELAPLYTSMGVNFLPVDYRGYGRSGGLPTVTAMMRDSLAIVQYVIKW
ncbi:MAG: alpha/beta hydrolase [Thermodesulfobacteriota bacterium]